MKRTFACLSLVAALASLLLTGSDAEARWRCCRSRCGSGYGYQNTAYYGGYQNCGYQNTGCQTGSCQAGGCQANGCQATGYGVQSAPMDPNAAPGTYPANPPVNNAPAPPQETAPQPAPAPQPAT